jgi:hypothetical protein
VLAGNHPEQEIRLRGLPVADQHLQARTMGGLEFARRKSTARLVQQRRVRI